MNCATGVPGRLERGAHESTALRVYDSDLPRFDGVLMANSSEPLSCDACGLTTGLVLWWL